MYARGRAQLGELTDQLRAKNIGAVYTSDLRRAQATVDAIAEAVAGACYMRPTLREIDFGQWEGLTWKQIEQRDKIYARRWVAEYPRLSAPNGESFRDFEQRVLNEVKFLSMRAAIEGRRIAVVTHAGVLRLVLCVLHECSEDEAWEQTRSYCSIVHHPIPASSSAQMAEV